MKWRCWCPSWIHHVVGNKNQVPLLLHLGCRLPQELYSQHLLGLRVDLFSYKAIVTVRNSLQVASWSTNVRGSHPNPYSRHCFKLQKFSWRELRAFFRFFIILSILLAEESSWRCGIVDRIICLKKVSSFEFFSLHLWMSQLEELFPTISFLKAALHFCILCDSKGFCKQNPH